MKIERFNHLKEKDMTNEFMLGLIENIVTINFKLPIIIVDYLTRQLRFKERYPFVAVWELHLNTLIRKFHITKSEIEDVLKSEIDCYKRLREKVFKRLNLQ